MPHGIDREFIANICSSFSAFSMAAHILLLLLTLNSHVRSLNGPNLLRAPLQPSQDARKMPLIELTTSVGFITSFWD